jgi:hypothetical protein
LITLWRRRFPQVPLSADGDFHLPTAVRVGDIQAFNAALEQHSREFGADVAQRDARVGERDGPEGGLDHVVAEAVDESREGRDDESRDERRLLDGGTDEGV